MAGRGPTIPFPRTDGARMETWRIAVRQLWKAMVRHGETDRKLALRIDALERKVEDLETENRIRTEAFQ